VLFNPIFVCYVLISTKEAILFVDPAKVPATLKEELQNSGVILMDYSSIKQFFSGMEKNSGVMLDPGKTNYSLYQSLPSNCRIIEGLGIVTVMKAVKNSTEIEGLRKVMIKDGIAWVKFLHWLDKNIEKIKIDELSAAKKLEAFRGEQAHFQGPSFHPISSFAEHGAVVHYSVSESSAIDLEPNNIYLCDTGGQYLDGTTDTTRTITLGEVTPEQKKDFTLALKGTIGVSMLRFPMGTKGYQMDILARKALWDHGLNYGHGTGHGVGFFLNVHEGPQTIGTGASGHMNTSMVPGMVTTVEPAMYRDGQYGMRTENVTLVVEDIENEFGRFYTFETLTLAPIDINLIDSSLLSLEEKSWINNYHMEVRAKLRAGLDKEEEEWLVIKTLPI
jgi:Xaa-Pro aminopeptidase